MKKPTPHRIQVPPPYPDVPTDQALHDEAWLEQQSREEFRAALARVAADMKLRYPTPQEEAAARSYERAISEKYGSGTAKLNERKPGED